MKMKRAMADDEQMVHSEDPQGTKLTQRERWEIVKKLRRSLGDDPEECLLNPIGAAKKMFGMPLDQNDCAST